jgi:hypothetical protein
MITVYHKDLVALSARFPPLPHSSVLLNVSAQANPIFKRLPRRYDGLIL